MVLTKHKTTDTASSDGIYPGKWYIHAFLPLKQCRYQTGSGKRGWDTACLSHGGVVGVPEEMSAKPTPSWGNVTASALKI